MLGDPELLKFLAIASERLRRHHNSLWEEEKHYSWWIYIIFAGLIFLYINQSLALSNKLTLIILGTLFGIFISLIGYNVVRRESEYFHEAFQIYDRTTKALGLDQPMPTLGDSDLTSLVRPVNVKDFNSVKSQANKSLRQLIIGASRRKLGIRDCFQLTFVTMALLFIVFGIFSAITLLP